MSDSIVTTAFEPRAGEKLTVERVVRRGKVVKARVRDGKGKVIAKEKDSV